MANRAPLGNFGFTRSDRQFTNLTVPRILAANRVISQDFQSETAEIGVATIGSIETGGVPLAWPAVDGSAGEVLTTDGAGTLFFGPNGGGGGSGNVYAPTPFLGTNRLVRTNPTMSQPNQVSEGTGATLDNAGNLTAASFVGPLIGNATSATNFSGSLAGDVTGGQTTTVVASVGGVNAATVATGSQSAANATSSNVANQIVKRDASGNFSAGTVTASSFVGNATSATNFSGPLAGDVTGTQSATVVSLVGGSSAASVSSGAVLANASTSLATPNAIVRRNGTGGFSAGTVNASSFVGPLTGNATSATSFTGSLMGDVIGTQAATVVSSVGGASASSVATGSGAANAATSSNTASTIVKRDASGNFTAGTITANLNGNATSTTNFSGSLNGDVTGTQTTTMVASVGGVSASNVASGANAANAAASTNTASTIVKRDASGNFAAGTITANLIGNATSTTNFSGSLAGDVTGTQAATVVATVGGSSASSVATGAALANAATNINTPSTIVKRDASGNFAAGTITGTLNGAATSATNFSGSLAGDVTGTQSATVVSQVGGVSASTVATGSSLAAASTASNAANQIVKRDASGNFAAGTITANLLGSSTSSTNFTGPLAGDVTGTQASTSVAFVGGQSAANVASATTAANAATNLNTPSTIVKRDASGNFAAGVITADLVGNASTATTAASATNFSGSLSGDVTGTQSATVVSLVGGQSATNVASATLLANASTSTNTPGAIVRRDGTGNFSATTVTANLVGNVTGNLSGNATSATSATNATNFTGPLVGDVTGTQGATVVATVGGQTAAAVASGTALANAATSSNTFSEIVRRDASGNFAAGTVTADLVGNVTGNLSGNATTATSAASATTATNFTGALTGDVTGTQSATVVSLVGGQTASDVASATVLANAATASNNFGAIVRRDGLGNAAFSLITLSDPPVSPTDATNKAYVDLVATSGFDPQAPVVALANSNVASLSGPTTIDSVGVVAGNRVLLVNQTNPVENGLWVVQTLAWTRPIDFATGSMAGRIYVVVLMGTTYTGTSWICSTPLAVVDTDPVAFVEFALAPSTNAANVGTGVGEVFRDQTGNTLNFKTLSNVAPGSLVANPNGHVLIDNDADEVNFATDATSSNVASSIVSRDASGNFSAGTITANLTGSASNNVLKAGDTMTGDLLLSQQSSLQFSSPANANTVGFRAPATIAASWNLDLPPTAPSAGQFLRAITPSTTAWFTLGGSTAVTRSVYATLAGNDLLGDGSIAAPFRTVSKALAVANASMPTILNPILVVLGAGQFVENNSGGPIVVNQPGISIATNGGGTSTVITPSDNTQDLFLIQTGDFEIINVVLRAIGVNTAKAIDLQASSGTASIRNVVVLNFGTGVAVSNPAPPSFPTILIDGLICADNGIGLQITDSYVVLHGSLFGTETGAPTPFLGARVSGLYGTLISTACSTQFLGTCLEIQNGASASLSGWQIVANGIGVDVSLAGRAFINGCTFLSSFVTALQASGIGSRLGVEGTGIDGTDIVTSLPGGTGVSCTGGAICQITASILSSCALAVEIGAPTDTSSTSLVLTSTTIRGCVQDIVQQGQMNDSAEIQVFAGSLDPDQVTLSDPSHADFSTFNSDTGTLAIGSLADEPTHSVIEILNSTVSADLPRLVYHSTYYDRQALVYENPKTGVPSAFGVQAQDDHASLFCVTGDRTSSACLSLISDTGGFGSYSNAVDVRGWTINRDGAAANTPLKFLYANSDSSGQPLRSSYSVCELDGVDNQVSFPLAPAGPTNSTAKLVWGADTDLSRASAGVLRTSGNFQVGALTSNRALYANGSGQLTSSTATNVELGYLSGVTSPIQTQLNNLLPISGGTLTGTLTLPAGTTALPSLLFTGSSTGTGLSAPAADSLTLSTSGASRLSVSAAGAVSIPDIAASSGVVHAAPVTGQLSSSPVVGADIANNTIPDSKLQTISTAGKVANSATTATNAATPNAIVSRDASGNFSAGTITATLNGSATSSTNFTGSLSGDVTGTQSATVVALVGGVSAANVAAGSTLANNSTNLNTASQIVRRDASGNFSAGTITASLSGNATSATTATTATNFTGSLAGDVTGTQGATVVSTVGGVSAANVASGANLANAATNLNTPSTIVRRDASGNFVAGTITATLNGNASTATSSTNFSGSLSGDVMGTQSATVVSTVGGVTATNVATGANLANAATAVNTPSTIVRRDASGNFAAGTITASLNGNATTATSATNFSGSLTGDVTGTQSATVVSSVGGQTAANVAAGAVLANAATNANTASTIVRRDASGNFAAGVITASLNGNATTATTATSFSGSLAGDVTGTQGATVVSFVGSQSAANVAAGTILANASTNLNTASTIVRRDASGNFSAGTITANLNGNATSATTATNATNFTGSLSGDVTGTQSATVVSSVGGQTATNVAAATVLANAATNLNTASTIVRRDASGNFAAGTITANLSGNATTATTATNFTGSLSGDVTGTQSATVVSSVGGQTATNVAAATVLANAATNLNTASTIVRRDASGNFSAGTITANLSGNATSATTATTATTAGSATNFTGSLSGDVTGTQSSTVVSSVGGQTATNVAAATVLANAATSANTASTIVRRDASGNFSAGTITANLSGNATTATSATSFSGSLAGDVTGTQSATVVSSVGGVTAANVASGANLANAATSSNTASTIVRRDASGNFTAGTVTANALVTASNAASSLRLGDTSGSGNFVQINPASAIGTSYTFALPAAAGAAGQALVLSSPTTTAWTSIATDPTTTTGDLIYNDGSGLARLPIGTSTGMFLSVFGGIPAWNSLLRQVSSRVMFQEDFLGPVTANFSVASASGGTVTSNSPTAADNSFGCARLTITNNTSSRSVLSQIPNLNWGQGVVTYGARVQFSALSTGANPFTARIGFGNNTGAGAHTAGAWFQYSNASANWVIVTDSANSGTSVSVATNTWYLLQIVSSAAAPALFNFFINGVSFGVIGSVAGTGTRVGLNIKLENNGVGTPTGTNLFVDYVTLECPTTASRGTVFV